jgi:hypothetical protein
VTFPSQQEKRISKERDVASRMPQSAWALSSAKPPAAAVSRFTHGTVRLRERARKIAGQEMRSIKRGRVPIRLPFHLLSGKYVMEAEQTDYTAATDLALLLKIVYLSVALSFSKSNGLPSKTL